MRRGKKEVYYLVKWENYPKDESTWEPVENLDTCPMILEKFLNELKVGG